MASSSKPNYILSFTIFILSSTFAIFLAKATKLGLTAELIHRDSPLSPLFDNSTTPYQKIHNALRRSANRLNYFFFPNNNSISAETNKEDDPESDITVFGSEYLMTYSLGTPAFETRGFADTGSDLVWLQCLPCQSCYPQDIAKFDPLDSSSHVNIRCLSQRCDSARLSASKISCDSDMCKYKQTYGDRISVSEGIIGYDTLTLGSSSGGRVRFPRFMFGCGYNNTGRFSRQTSGIVGLGRGPLSLVSQLRSSIEGRFSYCLVPSYEAYSGKLKFGQNAVVNGPEVVSTPLESGFPPNHYYLTLEAMSVGNKRLEFTPVKKGNILIDSGTTLTFLPLDFYAELESEVSAVLDLRLNRAQDPSGFLELCYETNRVENVGAPTITVHFSGADVKLGSRNTFVMVDYDVACFAFKDASQGSVYGNVAQLNFFVGYDLQHNHVFFKPEDCTKL